jgi:hypothetical protein
MRSPSHFHTGQGTHSPPLSGGPGWIFVLHTDQGAGKGWGSSWPLCLQVPTSGYHHSPLAPTSSLSQVPTTVHPGLCLLVSSWPSPIHLPSSPRT